MYHLDRVFRNPEDMREFILDCEADFILQIQKNAVALEKNKRLKLLGLAGPTCSGKTTISAVLSDYVKDLGKNLVVVSIDDFFLGKDERALEEQDFESVDAIDFPYLRMCVERILSGRVVMLPHYNFRTGMRDRYTLYEPDEKDIILFEGIQALYPEITALMPKECFEGIFVCPGEDVEAYGSVFSEREIRLMRRVVRDELFRGMCAERTLRLWKNVVANEEKNIFPYAKNAAIHITSFLPYELSVAKPFVIQVLSGIPEESPYSGIKNEILKKLEPVPVIDAANVPPHSFFREFIGPAK